MLVEIIENSERWFDLTLLPNEEFADIKDYEGLYQISNYGRVKTLERYYFLGNNKIKVKEKILKSSNNNYGYANVTLSKKNKQKEICTHTLVAKHFIPNPENKPTINHKDGNKKNNKISNLEWATYSEQEYHAYQNKLRGKNFGTKNGMYGKTGANNHLSKPLVQKDLQGNIIKKWENAFEVVRTLGFTQAGINKCCLGKQKTYKGFLWEYI